MNATVKITKIAVNGAQVILTPNWISNGHWMVSRGKVANAPLFTSVDSVLAQGLKSAAREFTDEECSRIMPNGNAHHVFEVSEWTKRVDKLGKVQYRRLDGGNETEQDESVTTFIDEKYVKLFGLEIGDKLYCEKEDGRSGLRDDAETFVIMPVRA